MPEEWKVLSGEVDARRSGVRLMTARCAGLAVFLCALGGPVDDALANGMALPGTFNVTERGGATYRVDIAVPPGTDGSLSFP